MKVILVGYMGSGKTTVGQKLADKLKLPFFDLDAYIEAKESKTIAQIFEEDGHIVFRKKEHRHLNSLLHDENDGIIATGGGAPCYAGNMKLILEATPNVFYLKLSITELVKRLAIEKDKRPLIAHLNDDELSDFIGKHLFERNGYYGQAPFTIRCDGKTAETISTEINKLLV